MFNKYLTYYSPAIQFTIFCLIVSLSFFLGAVVMNLINENWIGLTAQDLAQIQTMTQELSFKFKISNSIGLLFVLLLPSLLFSYLAYPKPMQYLGFQKQINSTFLILSLALFICTLPGVSLVEQLSRHIPIFSSKGDDHYDIMAKAMLQGSSMNDFLLNTLSICLIPAIVEELFFRACLQQVLLNWFRKNPYFILILVAVLFSAFHGQMSGFLPRVYLGLVLGLIYYFTGNILLSIIFHFLNNFITVFFSFLKAKGVIQFDIYETGDVNIFIGIAGVGLTIFLLYVLFQRKREFPIFQMSEEIKN